MFPLLLELTLILLSDADLRLNLGLQLLLQVPHLLLVILDQVDQLEDLLAWLLLI